MKKNDLRKKPTAYIYINLKANKINKRLYKHQNKLDSIWLFGNFQWRITTFGAVGLPILGRQLVWGWKNNCALCLPADSFALVWPTREMGRKGSEREHERQKGDFYYFVLFFRGYTSLYVTDVSIFSRSNTQREKGKQVKQFWNKYHIGPFHFSYHFNLPFSGLYQRLVKERGTGGRGIWRVKGEGNDCKEINFNLIFL